MTAWWKKTEIGMENQCCSYARKNGFMAIKLSPQSLPGIPDRIILGPRRTILFVEFKLPDNKDRKIHLNRQFYIHKKLRKFGFSVHCIKSIESFKRLLNIYIGD